MSQFLVFGGGTGIVAPAGGASAMSFETITINFFGVDNTTLTSVSNPQVRIEREGVVKTDVQSLNLPVPAMPGYFTPSPVSAGQYTFTFSTHSLEAGLYDFISSGVLPTTQTVTLKGQFIISYVSKTKEYVDRLRKRLFDIDASLYLLDEPRKIFPDDMLLEYLLGAVSEINFTPPGTSFTLESQGGHDISDLIIRGGIIRALRSRGVLEIFNKLSYSDSQSLAIDRQPGLSMMANDEEKSVQEQTKRWKSWYAIYGSGKSAVGMGTTTIPLQVSRALSMLPNLSQTFSL